MTSSARDVLHADVVCVGAGIASLSCALRFLRSCRRGADSEPPTVLILEKGANVGAHVLSGAVLNTEPLQKLLSADEVASLPLEAAVTKESFYRLTRDKAVRLPFTPPPMRARGLPLCSLSSVTKWLGDLCEKEGAEIYTDLAVTEVLHDNGRVIGVRVGDKGLNKAGQQKPNFEAGAEIHAKVVVLGEGACGFLTEQVIEAGILRRGPEPQTYALGIKELIETEPRPNRAGRLLHSFGYPLDAHTYGGGFVYGLNESQVALGFVSALDYRHPELNPHDLFRAFKRHPLIQPWTGGGHVISYGAKMLPERGFAAVPQLYADGLLIVGDGAGLLDAVQLKGADLAIESGIAAGDTLADCRKAESWTPEQLAPYPARLKATKSWKKLYRHRNVRPWFQLGQLPGIAATGLAYVTGGLLPPARAMLPDYELSPVHEAETRPTDPGPTDPVLQMDVLSDLYYSGTQHEEDQPPHVIIKDPERCLKECIPTYGTPCTRFCPAQVYEFEEGDDEVRVVASNCMHCRTCQIKCPLQNVEWRLPEGGGGPRYKGM